MLHDLKVATIFLTRLPLRVDGEIHLRDLATAVHLFPVVGVLVGLAGGLAFWLASGLGIADAPAAVIAVAAMVAATGALHEDGLADTADALGAGADRERALAIMRDSRIGTFGAVALVLFLLARVAAIVELDDPGDVAAALVAAAALSRGVLPVVMRLLPSGRGGGLASDVGRPELPLASAAMAVAITVAFIALPELRTVVPVLVVGALAAGTAVVLARRFGGCTGDTLGAVQQVAEVAFLIAASADG